MHAPWRQYAELYTIEDTLLRVLSQYAQRKLSVEPQPLKGLDILDIGCGTGTHCRWAKSLGARRVVGVDVSAAMLSLAEAQEIARTLRVHYTRQDASRLPELGKFDAVLAVHVFDFTTELRAVLQHIARALHHGGWLLAVVANPNQVSSEWHAASTYGVGREVLRRRRKPSPRAALRAADGASSEHKSEGPGLREGEEVLWTNFNSDGTGFHFTTYYTPTETYEAALKAVGFQEIAWTPMRVSSEGYNRMGEDYWREMLEQQPWLLLTAHL